MLIPQSSLLRKLHRKTDSQLECSEIAEEYPTAPTGNRLSPKHRKYNRECNQHSEVTAQNGSQKLTMGLQDYEQIKKAHNQIKSHQSTHSTVKMPSQCGQSDAKTCDYSFVPNVCKGTHSTKGNRTFAKFIENQQNYQAQKHAKIDRLRMQMNDMETHQCTATPQIDNKSRAIFDHRQGKQVFSRLSKQKLHCPTQTLAVKGEFAPKILMKSKSLKRRDKVSNLLYEDAQRRMQKQSFTDTQNIQTNGSRTAQNFETSNTFCDRQMNQRPSLTNANTNALVFKKLKSEALQMIEEQRQISPILAISILSELFNIDLNPNRGTAAEELCHKVLLFMIESTEDKIETDKFISFIQIVVVGCSDQSASTRYFSSIQQQQIYAQFGYFYRQRLAREKKAKAAEVNCFHPQTLKASNRMAKNHRQRKLEGIVSFLQANEVNMNYEGSSLRIQDLFLLDTMRKTAELEAKQRERVQKQLRECSFRPSLQHSSQWRKQRRVDSSVLGRNRVASQEAKALKTPIEYFTESHYDYENSQSDTKQNKASIELVEQTHNKQRKKVVLKGKKAVKDFDKNLLRMSIGRKQRAFEEKSKERGYPKGENYTRKRTEQRKELISEQQRIKGYHFAAAQV